MAWRSSCAALSGRPLATLCSIKDALQLSKPCCTVLCISWEESRSAVASACTSTCTCGASCGTGAGGGGDSALVAMWCATLALNYSRLKARSSASSLKAVAVPRHIKPTIDQISAKSSAVKLLAILPTSRTLSPTGHLHPFSQGTPLCWHSSYSTLVYSQLTKE